VRTNLNLLWTIPVLALLIVFSTGAAMFFSAIQVYFRDMASFLPYILRITLYLSPILWTVEELGRRGERVQQVIRLNPLFDMIGAWSLALKGERPPGDMLLIGAGWALFAFVLGALVFVSREREFAVRL
jgi:teichoic acid transport system permease protein